MYNIKQIKTYKDLYLVLSHSNIDLENKNPALFKLLKQAAENHQLSIDVTGVEIWNGLDAAEISVFALKTSDSIKNGAVSLMTGKPKGKDRISTMILSGSNPTGRQLPSCDPVPIGGVAFDPDNLIEDFEIESYTEFCARDLEPSVFQNKFLEEELPSNILDAIVLLFTESRKRENEYQMWMGDTAGVPAYAFFDGFIKLINADANVLTPGGWAVHTSLNIQAQFEIAYQFIPEGVKTENWLKEMRFNVGTADKWLIGNYIFAASAAGSTIVNGFSIVGDEYFYRGIKINFSFAIENDVIIAASSQDLWVKTTDESRWNEFQYEKLPFPSEKFGMKSKYTMGVAIKRTSYIVNLKA